MDSILTYVYYGGNLRALADTTAVSQQHAFYYTSGHYANDPISLSDSIKTAIALNRTVQITDGLHTHDLTPGTEQTLNFPAHNTSLHCLLSSTSFKVFDDSTTSTPGSGTTTFTLKSTLNQYLDLPQETWSPTLPQVPSEHGVGWYIPNTKALHCVDCAPFVIKFVSLTDTTNQKMFFLVESDPEYVILCDRDGDELRFEYDVTFNEYVGDISSYAGASMDVYVTPLMHSKALLVNNKIVCTSGSFVAKLQPYLPTDWDVLPTAADQGFDVIFNSDVVHLLTDADCNNVLRTPDGALRGIDTLKHKFYYFINSGVQHIFGFNTNNPSQETYLAALNNMIEDPLEPGTDSTYFLQITYSNGVVPS